MSEMTDYERLTDSMKGMIIRAELAEAQLNEIRGVVGFPGTDELNKYGLSESLPDVVRCVHRQWLAGTHAAQQSVLREQARADKAHKFLMSLGFRGGSIVSSAACSVVEIAFAQAACDERWFQIDSYGFVWRPAPNEGK